RPIVLSDMSAEINLDRLERELEQAVEADRRYWEKNDAKFRAVNQRVASYEEFKEIVNASHLKPLDRGEKVTEIRTNETGLWNRGRSRGGGGAGVEGREDSGSSLLGATSSTGEPPASCQQFVRSWQSLKTPEYRRSYLLSLAPSVYSNLFASEIPFGLLGEFVTALDAADSDKLPTQPTVSILTALTNCQRFQLALAFFSQSEKQAAQRLMKRLAESAATTADGTDEAEAVAKLSQLYIGEA
ncbi:hypothetical protein BOX15_Mlig029093g1, partial [Macrostomum lignano]